MEYPILLPWTDESFFSHLHSFLQMKNIPIRGVLHIGAHTCEEKVDYNEKGIPDENILWIEGNAELAEANRQKGIPNVYTYLISDAEKEVTFHITNSKASSSLFPLHVHKYFYPHIVEVEQQKQTAISLKTFFEKIAKNPSDYNLWSLDIQGAEFDALKGAGDILDTVDMIFTEVNFELMYENITLFTTLESFLKEKGFRMTHVKVWQRCWGDALFVKEKYLLGDKYE
jgi:FkbM family methyltransferase